MTHQKLDEKLTKWEVGNILVRVRDEIAFARIEIVKGGNEEVALFMLHLEQLVKQKFKDGGFDKEMGFGI